MSANAYKQSTGYYTLKVIRATNIDASAEDLYVELRVKDSFQRTCSIPSVSDTWTETFPIRVPMKSTQVSLSLLRKSRFFPFSRTVGSSKMTMSDLVKECEGKEEASLKLSHSKTHTGELVVILRFSEVAENANVALQNLTSLLDGDEELPLSSLGLDNTNERIALAVKEGKDAMRSKLAQTAAAAIPAIDAFVDKVDKVVQAHPLLNIGWQLAAAIYKVASEQIKLDKKVEKLLTTIISAFDFAKDASRLAKNEDGIDSLRRATNGLMDQLIKCSLFLQEYVRRKFLKRIISQSYDIEKVKEITKDLQSLRQELIEGVDLQAKIGEHEAHVEQRCADALKAIRKSFELTPIMLDDMESSSHRECLEKTRGEWIEEIVTWALSDSDQVVFWMRGIPGCGKSTVAQTIAHHPRIQPHLVSHVFFKRETTRRHDVLKLISYKLADSNTDLALAIAARLGKPRSNLLDAFRNLILEPLNEVSVDTPMIIILDGLDEYGTSESRTPLMQLFRNECAKLPRRVRIFITSRPEADIVRALSGVDHISEKPLDHDSENTRRDVSTYIAVEMKKLVKAKASEGPSWEEKMVIFSNAADGLFIWASIAIQLVRSAPRPYKKLCALADNETKLTLDDLYKKAPEAVDLDWKNADARQIFAMLFALILPNRGKLTIELFDLLLEFEADSSEETLFKLLSFLSYSTNGLVQIHHKTFADFLQSRARLPAEPWYISMSHQNQFIAMQCFTAMEELHFDMCGCVTRSGEMEVAVGDVLSHIVHGSIYWADYLRGSEFSEELLKCLRTFVTERLLFWMEALSHLKEFSRVAKRALLQAIDWVSSRSTSMHSSLRDAISTASEFSTVISISPKLIYTTVLPLTSKKSSISTQYSKLLVEPVRMSKVGGDVAVKEANITTSQEPFLGHKGAVSSVIFSPDMQYVISGSYDRTVMVWNAQTGEAVRSPFKGHTEAVYSVAVSPEGQIIASGSGDGTIQLWDAETGSAIGKPLQGHDKEVNFVAFSPNGRRIISGSGDRTTRFWDVDTGKPVGKPLKGHTSSVRSVAYSPDGRRIVSGSYDNTVRLWGAETGAAVGEPLTGHSGDVWSVTFSPDGRWIASSSADDTIQIWDVETGATSGEPLRGHQDTVRAVALSPDGRRLASASDDSTVRIWDMETREAVGEPLRGHEEKVLSVAYSRDGSRIISGSWDRRIIVWDALTLKPIIGTGIKPSDDALQTISGDGSNLEINECQFFEGWRMEDGWLLGAEGEHRLWMPGYMRKLVKQVNEGLYVHQQLDLKNCNAASEEFKGFIISD